MFFPQVLKIVNAFPHGFTKSSQRNCAGPSQSQSCDAVSDARFGRQVASAQVSLAGISALGGSLNNVESLVQL